MDACALMQAQVGCGRHGLVHSIVDDLLEYSWCDDYVDRFRVILN